MPDFVSHNSASTAAPRRLTSAPEAGSTWAETAGVLTRFASALARPKAVPCALQIVYRRPARAGTFWAKKANSPVESRCEGTTRPLGPVTTSPVALISLLSTTRSVRGQPEVFHMSTAPAVWSPPCSARTSASSFCDSVPASKANACLIFHCSFTKGKSGSVMLLYAPQVCSS